MLNDCKYSYSVKENEIALTAVRSPIYCDHGAVCSEESNYTDQGEQEFTYALYSATTKEKTKIVRRALVLNTPPIIVLENHHNGTLPLMFSGIYVSEENILVSALKKSEDGNAYVLRVYECEGKETDIAIDIYGLGKQLEKKIFTCRPLCGRVNRSMFVNSPTSRLWKAEHCIL